MTRLGRMRAGRKCSFSTKASHEVGSGEKVLASRARAAA